MECQNISLAHSPSRIYRIRKKIPIHSSSLKKIKIAKKIDIPEGFPKPLSCEEDFVIELKNNPLEFLKPVSGYYNIPEVNQGINHIKSVSDINLHNRSIVGPLELFKKSWQNNHSTFQDCTEIMRKNRSYIESPNKRVKNLQISNKKNKHFEDSRLDTTDMENKLENLHKKQVNYWKKINANVKRKITRIKIKKLVKSYSI